MTPEERTRHVMKSAVREMIDLRGLTERSVSEGEDYKELFSWIENAIRAAEQAAVERERKWCADIARHWIEAADRDAPGKNHDMRKTAGRILAAIENPPPQDTTDTNE